MVPKLGLKTSSDSEQLNSRLIHQPEILEFYTDQADFSKNGLKRLNDAIQEVKERATDKIILHQPMTFQGDFLEMIVPKELFPKSFYFLEKSTSDLLQLAFDHHIQVLLHGSYEMRNQALIAYYGSWEAANQYLFDQLDKFSELGQAHIMFENSISPLFYFGDPDYDALLFAKNYRLAYDLSHAFIKMRGSNRKLLASLKTLKDHIVHYHLVDSMGKTHDSLPLGQGKINWKAVLELLDPDATSIYEINLKNMLDPTEQLQSHNFLLQLAQK